MYIGEESPDNREHPVPIYFRENGKVIFRIESAAETKPPGVYRKGEGEIVR